jgi:hypothetical protein
MIIYRVERDSSKGIEQDLFTDYKLAKLWAKLCNGSLREEKTWSEKFTTEMIEAYTYRWYN